MTRRAEKTWVRFSVLVQGNAGNAMLRVCNDVWGNCQVHVPAVLFTDVAVWLLGSIYYSSLVQAYGRVT
jgi:hypothetical protein